MEYMTQMQPAQLFLFQTLVLHYGETLTLILFMLIGTKIYDITTKTWLMESIICDLSQYAPTERTMAHISGTANVLDFYCWYDLGRNN